VRSLMPSSGPSLRGVDSKSHNRGLRLSVGRPLVVGAESVVQVVEDHRREQIPD